MGFLDDILGLMGEEGRMIKSISDVSKCARNRNISKEHLDIMAKEVEDLCCKIVIHPCCNQDIMESAKKLYSDIIIRILSYNIEDKLISMAKNMEEKSKNSEH